MCKAPSIDPPTPAPPPPPVLEQVAPKRTEGSDKNKTGTRPFRASKRNPSLSIGASSSKTSGVGIGR